jgi:hypothetical protein
MSEEKIDNYENYFKNLEGQYVGYYDAHGFEIIELKYQFQEATEDKFSIHLITATKLTGDPYVK